MVVIEVQGVLVADKSSILSTRSAGIRYLLESLIGLIRAANASQSADTDDEGQKTSILATSTERSADGRPSRRTKIQPDVWQDTLSLLCDADALIRNECAAALIYYITQEMPKYGKFGDVDRSKHPRNIAENTFRHLQSTFPNIGDIASKFLNSVHAYVYILATSPTLHNPSALLLDTKDPSSNGAASGQDEHYDLAESGGNLTPPPNSNNRRSIASQHGARERKESLVLRLLEKIPLPFGTSAEASEEDYANILKIMTTIHIHLPMHGLLTGVPMLLALESATEMSQVGDSLLQRIITVKTVIAHVWRVIAQVWKIPELMILGEQVCSMT